MKAATVIKNLVPLGEFGNVLFQKRNIIIDMPEHVHEQYEIHITRIDRTKEDSELTADSVPE